jgi:uridine kinase
MNNLNSYPDFYVLEPKKILIVEGMFIFKYPEIRRHLNLMLYVECDADVRFGRLSK